MLAKFEVTIQPKAEGLIKGNIIEKIHGAVFFQLKEIDSVFTTFLHNEQNRSFNLSPIIGNIKKKEGNTVFPKDNQYRFYITTLNEATTMFFEKWSENNKGTMYIGELEFAIVRIKVIDKTTYHELIDKATKNADLSEINIQFLSPTSFRRQGTQIIIPDPELIFKTLLKKWVYYSEYPLEMRDNFSYDLIQVGQYKLHTELVSFSNYKIIGFKGDLKLKLSKKIDAYHKMLIVLLMEFANYNGIGYKTTMGLGFVQTKIS